MVCSLAISENIRKVKMLLAAFLMFMLSDGNVKADGKVDAGAALCSTWPSISEPVERNLRFLAEVDAELPELIRSHPMTLPLGVVFLGVPDSLERYMRGTIDTVFNFEGINTAYNSANKSTLVVLNVGDDTLGLQRKALSDVLRTVRQLNGFVADSAELQSETEEIIKTAQSKIRASGYGVLRNTLETYNHKYGLAVLAVKYNSQWTRDEAERKDLRSISINLVQDLGLAPIEQLSDSMFSKDSDLIGPTVTDVAVLQVLTAANGVSNWETALRAEVLKCTTNGSF